MFQIHMEIQTWFYNRISHIQLGKALLLSKTGGSWSLSEETLHITVLKLKVAWLTVPTFCKHFRNDHIQVQSENTTAVAHINHLRGNKHACNEIAR